jgi:hypothetical protein
MALMLAYLQVLELGITKTAYDKPNIRSRKAPPGVASDRGVG